jgi:GNAT superfamily N-acetyltransferase
VTVEISDLAAVPAFFNIVAERIWREWHAPRGATPAELRARLTENMAGARLPKAFVAHRAEKFLGTISLIANDLDERPDFSPWAAALWVEPEARENGVGAALLRHAAAAALNDGENALYLCAREAISGYYLARGWRLVETGIGPRRLSVLRLTKQQEPPCPRNSIS